MTIYDVLLDVFLCNMTVAIHHIGRQPQPSVREAANNDTSVDSDLLGFRTPWTCHIWRQ